MQQRPNKGAGSSHPLLSQGFPFFPGIYLFKEKVGPELSRIRGQEVSSGSVSSFRSVAFIFPQNPSTDRVLEEGKVGKSWEKY
jgi:hypothetical protein